MTKIPCIVPLGMKCPKCNSTGTYTRRIEPGVNECECDRCHKSFERPFEFFVPISEQVPNQEQEEICVQ